MDYARNPAEMNIELIVIEVLKRLTAFIPIDVNVEDNISSNGGECGHLRIRHECINCFMSTTPRSCGRETVKKEKR